MNTASRILSATLAVVCAPVLANPTCDDDDVWACCAFFCLANPQGPTAEPACKPPIERLHQFWRKHNAFPSCPGFGVQAATFDPCPPGSTQAIGAVRLAGPMPNVSVSSTGYVAAATNVLYQDDSVDIAGSGPDSEGHLGMTRVCVSGAHGSYDVIASDNNGAYSVGLYNQIYLQQRQVGSPYVMQVKQPDGSIWSYRIDPP